ncbi:response regulator receiver protein [Novosphingobium sp. Rr 2-17]|uniref:response regulator n=1 Tax=Novosphingobium sp. Rr 2-17 TaxID=555793 RepID=UPI00026994CB|nr:response regulator [Novosphingobium sp. Rr 2-17]EIZ81027.1 response regulator receiver protein [Novosphingobium sp. Rr 2-17]
MVTQDDMAALRGMRVLIAEDEALVSMMLEEMLEDLGCKAVGTHATLSSALAATREGDFDVALIDMNLCGESAEPIVAELSSRAIPFAIASGADALVPAKNGIILGKPYGFDQLKDTLTTLQAALTRQN